MNIFAFHNMNELPTISQVEDEDVLKIYFPMPYVTHINEIESESDTKVSKNEWGEVYKIKTRNFDKDTLYVSLTPDTDVQKITAEVDLMIKNISNSKDSGDKSNSKHSLSLDDILKFYIPNNLISDINTSKIAVFNQKTSNFSDVLYISQLYTSIIDSPPEA